MRGEPTLTLFDPKLPFFKGNTHAHTTLSDGERSPEAVMELYRRAGYDFLALTDHWHVGSAGDWKGMLLVPGVEYDFGFATQVLHLVCLFGDAADAGGIFRGMSHREVIRRVNAVGGVPIAAHPAWSLNTHDFLLSLDGVDLAEVYNTLSDEPFNGPRGNAEGILDVTAANGKLFNLVAADDSHCYRGEQCVSYVMVQAAELSVRALLDALKAGRFYASQGPRFESVEAGNGRLVVRTSPVSRITFCSNQYWSADRCQCGEGLTEAVYRVQYGERFVRVVVTDAAGRKAWCSPIPAERLW